MATRKEARRTAKKRPTRTNQAGSDTLRALRRENKKLRELIGDVWEVLNKVNDDDDGEAKSTVIESACWFIHEDFPEEYRYVEPEGPQQSKKAEGAVNVFAARARRNIAKEVGTTEEELSKITDFNLHISAWRKVAARADGLDEIKGGATPEEYSVMVAQFLMQAVLFTAVTPTTLKKEAKKFSDAARQIAKFIPQDRRKATTAVETAYSMRNLGQKWSVILPLAIPGYNDLPPRERGRRRSLLQKAVSEYVRRRRTAKTPR
jgi:hypothetical protein